MLTLCPRTSIWSQPSQQAVQLPQVLVTAGFTALEREQIVGHRWWSLDELLRTDAVVFPRALAPLLARLLAGQFPETPVELPW